MKNGGLTVQLQHNNTGRAHIKNGKREEDTGMRGAPPLMLPTVAERDSTEGL